MIVYYVRFIISLNISLIINYECWCDSNYNGSNHSDLSVPTLRLERQDCHGTGETEQRQGTTRHPRAPTLTGGGRESGNEAGGAEREDVSDNIILLGSTARD